MELIAFECNLNENCDYFEFQVEYFIEIVYFEELYTYMYTTAKKKIILEMKLICCQGCKIF